MRLILIRHGDPDYEKDSLTEKGWREAELLAERIRTWKVKEFFTSPLGRAKATASCTLNQMNRTAQILDWTREFAYYIDDPVTGRRGVPWDFVPSFWTADPLMYEKENWTKAAVMKQNPLIPVKYREVCENLDAFLSGYGYVREGNFYRMPDKKEIFLASTLAPGAGTHTDGHAAVSEEAFEEPAIVIFCHLGAIFIMLSHLLNIPFPLLVHGFFLPTSSVTILSTEERWSNEAYFRIQTLGDVSHLLGREPVSSAGYFARSFQK